jgi:tetratricopeptide (TPR) repeat protein
VDSTNGAAEAEDGIEAGVVGWCESGDRHAKEGAYDRAIEHYQHALDLLPAPVQAWEASAYIFAAIGNTYFLKGEYAPAYRALQDALRCPRTGTDALIHLRIGQVFLAWGTEELAATELAQAYMAGGAAIFEGEDARYFALVRSVLRTPADGVW